MKPLAFNSAEPCPLTKALLVIGFCANTDEEALLVASGIHPDQIWMRGRNAESLEFALRYFRKRAGVLRVAADLRLFGPTRKEINAVMAKFHDAGIIVEDIIIRETNPHVLTQKTFVSLAASAGIKNHRTARRRGRVGGIAKGIAAAIEREAAVPLYLIRRIVNYPGLSWRVVEDLLKEVASGSTLRRRYLEQG